MTARRVLVTGVSRRAGIGFAIARRLSADGASVFAQSWRAHDAAQPWGADPADVPAALGGATPVREVDLADPNAPATLLADAVATLGGLDALVLNHARSSDVPLAGVDAAELDACWAVNVRATLLLVRAFAEAFDGDDGRVVLFTSGQHLGPMPGEIPYVATKGALHQLTATLADELADRRITVNCVNPGPTDTGWAGPEHAELVRTAMPRGRWNTPDEAAAVVATLLGPDMASVTGQVINAEGGFRRAPG